MVIRRLPLFLVISTIFLNSSAVAESCNIGWVFGLCQATDKIVKILEHALNELDKHSADWQRVLEETS